jgi:hypothetical protein
MFQQWPTNLTLCQTLQTQTSQPSIRRVREFGLPKIPPNIVYLRCSQRDIWAGVVAASSYAAILWSALSVGIEMRARVSLAGQVAFGSLSTDSIETMHSVSSAAAI